MLTPEWFDLKTFFGLVVVGLFVLLFVATLIYSIVGGYQKTMARRRAEQPDEEPSPKRHTLVGCFSKYGFARGLDLWQQQRKADRLEDQIEQTRIDRQTSAAYQKDVAELRVRTNDLSNRLDEMLEEPVREHRERISRLQSIREPDAPANQQGNQHHGTVQQPHA